MRFFALISVFIVTTCGHQYTKLPLNSYSVPLGSIGPLPKISPLELNKSAIGFSNQDGFDANFQELDETIFSNRNVGVPSSFVYKNASSSPEELVSLSEKGTSSTNVSIDEDLLGQNIIQKNIYVHLPAPELGQHVQDAEVHPPIPQKHYKIIFIRPPTVSTAPVVPPSPESDHRTIVYVLTEKEEEEEVFAVASEPVEPSRPEVYFIRYNIQGDESDKSLTKMGSFPTSDNNGSNSKVSEECGSSLT